MSQTFQYSQWKKQVSISNPIWISFHQIALLRYLTNMLIQFYLPNQYEKVHIKTNQMKSLRNFK